MSNFRADITECSKYNVQLCESQKKIVFKFIENYRREHKRTLAFKHAVSVIVSEYGKIKNMCDENI